MPRTLFVLPQLPPPHYRALKTLCQLYGARQKEIVCIALAELAERHNVDPGRVRTRLDHFRSQAPSETAPLIPESQEARPLAG